MNVQSQIHTGAPPLPEKRMKCHGCAKPMPISKNLDKHHVPKTAQEIIKLDGTWSYGGYGRFCTLRCAERWANSVLDLISRGELKFVSTKKKQ